jgi:hypothetical protein
MRIHREQMKAMAEAMRCRFETEAMAMLRRMYPESTARHPDETLQLFVRHGIQRARLNGLDAVTDIERWLRLMMRLGPHFDSDERLVDIRGVLGRVEIYGPLRLEEVETMASRIAPEPK